MTDDIVHEATYPYPPETVWDALTRPEAIQAWLMETTFREPTVGHRFEFRDKPRMGWSGVTQCEVVEAVPPTRLAIRWGAPEDGFAQTLVEYDLTPVPGGTKLRLRHSGFSGVKGWMMRQGMNNGWGKIVQRAIPYVIERRLKGESPTRDEVKLVKRG